MAWGFSTVVFGFGCPLTYLENSMRVRGGDGALPSSGFIDHYITGVLYPRSALDVVRVLVIVIVAVSWVGFVQLRRRQRPRNRYSRPIARTARTTSSPVSNSPAGAISHCSAMPWNSAKYIFATARASAADRSGWTSRRGADSAW